LMVPETAASRTVELYRCVAFPDRWEPVEVLLHGVRAVDPTVACIDDRWWLFVHLPDRDPSENDDLHLYVADRPQGPWRPHRRNRGRSDVRSSRPAGRLLAIDGRYYRPAQDCSVRYGHAVVVHRIERLSETEYHEEKVGRIVPHRGLRAVHTLNRAGALTVVDAALGRWRWRR